jgi:hypothetical protein
MYFFFSEKRAISSAVSGTYVSSSTSETSYCATAWVLKDLCHTSWYLSSFNAGKSEGSFLMVWQNMVTGEYREVWGEVSVVVGAGADTDGGGVGSG